MSAKFPKIKAFFSKLFSKRKKVKKEIIARNLIKKDMEVTFEWQPSNWSRVPGEGIAIFKVGNKTYNMQNLNVDDISIILRLLELPDKKFFSVDGNRVVVKVNTKSLGE